MFFWNTEERILMISNKEASGESEKTKTIEILESGHGAEGGEEGAGFC